MDFQVSLLLFGASVQSDLEQLFLQELRYMSIMRLLVLNVSMILVYMFVYSTNVSKIVLKWLYIVGEAYI